MSASLRTFVAIKIFPEQSLLNLYADLQNRLKLEQIKWVDQHNLHITLMFLGDTNKNLLQPITEKLRHIANRYAQFQFHLNGIGYFKRGRQPSVIYSGTKNSVTLKSLADDVDKELALLGFVKQQNSFTPHLTLGRIKVLSDINKLNDMQQLYRDSTIQAVKVSHIYYFKSTLTPMGAIYKPIEILKLQT